MANMISVAEFFNLLKTKVGWMNPHHKYIYRIPLPGGGYEYVYNTAISGKNPPKDDEDSGPRRFSDEEAAKHNTDPEFIKQQDEAITELINFASNPVLVAKYSKDIHENLNAVYGPMWEIFSAINDVKSLSDGMNKIRYLMETYKDPQTQRVLREFVSRVAAFKKTGEDFHLDRMVQNNQVQWQFLKRASSIIEGIKFEYFGLTSTAHLQGGDRVADVVITDIRDDVNNALGILFINFNTGKLGALGLSQKVISPKGTITLKSNGIGKVTERFAAAADRLIKAGSSKAGNALKSWSDKMQQTYDSAKDTADHLSYYLPEHKKLRDDIAKYKRQGAAQFEKWKRDKTPEALTTTTSQEDIYRKYHDAKNRITKDIFIFRMRKLEKVFSEALADPDFQKGFSDEIFDIYAGAFHDAYVSELAMVMPTYDQKTQTSNIYIAFESKLRKELRKILSPGNFTVEMRNAGKKTVLGKSIDSFRNIEIKTVIGKKPVTIGDLRFREDEGKIYTRMNSSFMLDFVKSNNEADGLDTELRKRGHGESAKKSVLFDFDLFKATQTFERKKMNAKYIRKELTESGKVRYIYKETEPRTKKAEDVSTENRDKFLSSVDSVDAAFKTLFGEAVSEIDDAHFVCINAGCVSTRITKEIELLHDALDVPEKLRSQFSSAAGLINSVNGKMGFCIANFPEDVSDMVRKAAMMHEMGHAYFYGALRIKHKQPLTADTIDSKDKEQKDSLKKATKFVDAFGKIDDDIRKQAEESVVDVKGQDKETMLQEAISAYMVSPYAAETSEEHFAEAFSRYFILPEQLKKKEEAVYKHFNEFFGKYDGD